MNNPRIMVFFMWIMGLTSNPLFLDCATAERTSEFYVPPALETWVKWVEERSPNRLCALLGTSAQCHWSGRVSLKLDQTGGTFSYFVTADRALAVTLPGGQGLWPLQVKSVMANKEKVNVAVLESNGLPTVWLEKGEHNLIGEFSWSHLPDYLALPKDVAIVDLIVASDRVSSPQIDSQGMLSLSAALSSSSEDAQSAKDKGKDKVSRDSLQVSVSRRLLDGVPLQIQTILRLRISGKPRAVDLGDVIPPGSLVHQINTSLNYQMPTEGRLVIDARSGEFQVEIWSFFPGAVSEIRPPENASGFWPKNEVWAWVADEVIRSVEIAGAPQIDPEQTLVPQGWKSLPTFRVSRTNFLKLKETRYGETHLLPNSLQLDRHFILEEAGTRMTVVDSITGTMHQGWRLDVLPELDLGRVMINGQDTLITQNPKTKQNGVEIRNGEIQLQGESLLSSSGGVSSAVHWNSNFERVSATLSVPPGWTLLGISGAKNVPGAWLSTWSVQGVFFSLAAVLFMGKLFGAAVAIAVLASCVLWHDWSGNLVFNRYGLLCALALVCLFVIRKFLLHKVSDCRRGMLLLLDYSCVFILVAFALSLSAFDLFSAIYPQIDPGGIGSGLWMLPGLVAQFILGLLLLFFITRCALWVHGRIPGRRSLFVFGGGLLFVILGFFLFVTNSEIQPLRGSQVGALLESDEMKPDSQSFDDMRAPSGPMQQRPSLPKVRAEAFVAKGFDSSVVGGGSAFSASLAPEAMSSGEGAPPEEEIPPPAQPLLDDPLDQEEPITEIIQEERGDEDSLVQQGPGVPELVARSWTFDLEGLVGPEKQLRFFLVSPLVNGLIKLLRVVIVWYLLLMLMGIWKGIKGNSSLRDVKIGSLGVALMFTLLGHYPHQEAVAQDYPSMELLRELESRVNANRCQKDCTVAERAVLSIDKDILSLEVWLASKGDGAWALPGPSSEFMPQDVEMDRAQTIALTRRQSGAIWVRVPDGTHVLRMSGYIGKRKSLALRFDSFLGQLKISADGWQVEGLGEGGEVKGQVILTKLEVNESNPIVEENFTKQSPSAEKKERLEARYVVTRHLTLGVLWSGRTSVKRVGASDVASLVLVPLVTGEAVVQDELEVKDGMVLVKFPLGRQEVTWTSNFEPSSRLDFNAQNNPRVAEVWQLECNTQWLCRTEGLGPIKSMEENRQLWTFRPWPGENVSLLPVQLQGAPGSKRITQRVVAVYSLGESQLNTSLKVDLRSSEGGRQIWKFPADVELLSATINGREERLDLSDGDMSVPIRPGLNSIELELREMGGIKSAQKLPQISLGSDLTNVYQSVVVPEDRWLLAARGPAWGSVLMLWPFLLFVGVISAVFRLCNVGPLRAWEYFILGSGLVGLNDGMFLVVPLALIILELRRRNRLALCSFTEKAMNLNSFLLAALTGVVLVWAVISALSIEPFAVTAGGNEGGDALSWYSQKVPGGQLPELEVLSVPGWVWRGLMLSWAVWVILSLVKWWTWVRSSVASEPEIRDQ